MAGNDSLRDFISYVRSKGLATQTHFGVYFTPIGKIESTINTSQLLMFCSQTNLPGLNISTTPARIFGETFEFGYENIYTPVQMNFYIDANYEIKRIFDIWTNEVYDRVSRKFGYYKDYTTDIEIFIYNKEHDKVYSVKLFEAYPKTMGEIQLDYSGGGLSILPITFAYKYFDTYQHTASYNIGTVQNMVRVANKESVKDTIKSSKSVLQEYINDFDKFQKDTISKISTKVNEIKTTASNTVKDAMRSILKKKQ